MNVWPTTTTVTKMLLAATLKDYGIVSATTVMKGTGQTATVTKTFFNMNKIKVQTCCIKYSPGKIILVMYNTMGTKWQNTPKDLGFRIRIVFTSFPSQNLLSTRHQRMHKKSAWLPSRCYLQQHRGVLGMLL